MGVCLRNAIRVCINHAAAITAATIQPGCHDLHGKNWCAKAKKYPTDCAWPDGNPYVVARSMNELI